jgi:hypothetical protein
MRDLRVARLTFVVGGAVLAAVVAFTLTRSPPRVLVAGAPPTQLVYALKGDGEACQGGEPLPAGVTAIRLSIAAYVAARIRLRVYSGSQLLTEGNRGPDWTGTSVTVPVKPLTYATPDVTLCLNISPNSEGIYLFGREAPVAEALTVPSGGHLSGRVQVDYLTSGKGSWWSRLLAVARHMGLGRAFSGTWIVVLIAALMLAVGGLAGRLALRELS